MVPIISQNNVEFQKDFLIIARRKQSLRSIFGGVRVIAFTPKIPPLMIFIEHSLVFQ